MNIFTAKAFLLLQNPQAKIMKGHNMHAVYAMYLFLEFVCGFLIDSHLSIEMFFNFLLKFLYRFLGKGNQKKVG